MFEVALSELGSGLSGDLGFSLPLVASPQARVWRRAVGARRGGVGWKTGVVLVVVMVLD